MATVVQYSSMLNWRSNWWAYTSIHFHHFIFWSAAALSSG